MKIKTLVIKINLILILLYSSATSADKTGIQLPPNPPITIQLPTPQPLNPSIPEIPVIVLPPDPPIIQLPTSQLPLNPSIQLPPDTIIPAVQLPPDTIPNSPNLYYPLSFSSNNNTPTYVWEALPGVNWYHLRVQEENNGVQISQWYSSLEAKCSSGSDSNSGFCSVTPSVGLPDGGSIGWVMRAATNYRYGNWTQPKYFTVVKKPVLISPQHVTSDMTPTYKWEGIVDASGYNLSVSDETGNIINRFYSASDANCNNKEACFVTPETMLTIGEVNWQVIAYTPRGERLSLKKTFSANNTKGSIHSTIFVPKPILPPSNN